MSGSSPWPPNGDLPNHPLSSGFRLKAVSTQCPFSRPDNARYGGSWSPECDASETTGWCSRPDGCIDFARDKTSSLSIVQQRKDHVLRQLLAVLRSTKQSPVRNVQPPPLTLLTPQAHQPPPCLVSGRTDEDMRPRQQPLEKSAPFHNNEATRAKYAMTQAGSKTYKT